MVSSAETPARLEPCQLPHYSEHLANLVSAITAAATTLTARLHPQSAASLTDLVRVMNCYYSNLIEGHDTRPRDIAAQIARALLHRGEMPRGDASLVTNLPERTARTVLSRLVDSGLVASTTPKGPVSLRFTTLSADVLFPRLFPAQG